MTAETESENETLQSCEQMFMSVFPYYLSIGCSSDEFWNGAPWIAKSYRDADVFRQERKNYDAWLQGLYIYYGVKSAVDTFAWGFGGKKGARPEGYPERQIAITEREKQAEYELKRKEALEFFMRGQEG